MLARKAVTHTEFVMELVYETGLYPFICLLFVLVLLHSISFALIILFLVIYPAQIFIQQVAFTSTV
jgi:hypothetical protein